MIFLYRNRFTPARCFYLIEMRRVVITLPESLRRVTVSLIWPDSP